jgi:enoyl-CoA hydratase
MSLVRLEKNNHWGRITIDKPQALNALSSEVLRDLDQVLDQVEKESELRVLIITGEGEKAFVAGADIKEIHALDQKSARDFAGFGQNVFMRIENLKIPVIAAVNGFALGGGLELAMACDFIYASEKAKLGLPECTLGLMPGFGGSVRLARKVGPARAKEMTFTGGMISASEALAFGLVNKVCAPDQLMGECEQVAQTMALRAPLALAAIKSTIETTYGMSTQAAMEIEQKAFADLFLSEDCKEGTEAFIQKRQPDFKGK